MCLLRFSKQYTVNMLSTTLSNFTSIQALWQCRLFGTWTFLRLPVPGSTRQHLSELFQSYVSVCKAWVHAESSFQFRTDEERLALTCLPACPWTYFVIQSAQALPNFTVYCNVSPLNFQNKWYFDPVCLFQKTALRSVQSSSTAFLVVTGSSTFQLLIVETHLYHERRHYTSLLLL